MGVLGKEQPLNLKPIDRQVIVIVGASSGIGRSAALRAASRGAKVVAAGRSLPALENLVDEIHRLGGEAAAFPVEVSEFEQVKVLAEGAVQYFGRIDTWVNGAAVMIYAPFSEMNATEFKRLIEVNLLGQVYGTMAALPHIKKVGRGALIHISSVEARRSLPYQSAYASSKHGVKGFVDSLRMELNAEGLPISVSHLLPASINTPLYSKARTRLGVEPRPVPPVYQPGVVVDAILYAAEHPVREMIIGGAGKGLSLLERVAPPLADTFLKPYTMPLLKTDIPKSVDEPDNLFYHLEGYDTSRGKYDRESREFSLYTWLQLHPQTRWAAALAMLAAAAGFVYRTAKRSKT
jgi:NAD(P)-dependent dehydrogenase (short-subunit alcohol dehydrogenase family)